MGINYKRLLICELTDVLYYVMYFLLDSHAVIVLRLRAKQRACFHVGRKYLIGHIQRLVQQRGE